MKSNTDTDTYKNFMFTNKAKGQFWAELFEKLDA
jgi:hypothetical protein